MDTYNRSIRGLKSRSNGEYFERMIIAASRFYEDRGIAVIDKTPEAFKVIKPYNRDRGQFICCFTQQAQPDFKGALMDSTMVLFDAKHTDKGQISRNVVTEEQEDLQEEWIPNCFDTFFVAAGAGESFGGLLGWDSFEGDYFGIDGTDAWAEDEAKKKMKTITKDELIAAARQCFKVYQSYIGLRNRYDSLKAAIDILRDQNTGFLQTIKEIERLYEAASKEQGITAKYSTEWKEFERYTDALPQEAWIQ